MRKGLGCWVGYSVPKPLIQSLLLRGKDHSGTETRSIRLGGSSEEFLTMSESLIEVTRKRYF